MLTKTKDNDMKTANFTWKDKNGKASITGTIVLKDNGKVSISLHHATAYSSAQRYQAKALANEIVKADFNHEAVTFLKEQNAGKLVTILTDKTQDLKEEFLLQTKIFAEADFERAVEKSKRTKVQWFEAFNIAYELKPIRYAGANDVTMEPTPKYHGSDYYKMRQAQEKNSGIVRMGVEAFKAQKLKLAERHYTDSIVKLAYRINQLGVNDESTFEIKTVRLKQNFECYIKHEKGMIKAWTIIASGLIQQPHYRFLVKDQK